MAERIISPRVGGYGYYFCTCGNRVGCDGSFEKRPPVLNTYCSDCGALIDYPWRNLSHLKAIDILNRYRHELPRNNIMLCTAFDMAVEALKKQAGQDQPTRYVNG